jgi:hypothetical protein
MEFFDFQILVQEYFWKNTVVIDFVGFVVFFHIFECGFTIKAGKEFDTSLEGDFVSGLTFGCCAVNKVAIWPIC